MNPQVIAMVRELVETWRRADEIKARDPNLGQEADEIISGARSALVKLLSSI